MSIEVHCDCGNLLNVPAKLGGRKLKCKACGTVLLIPALGASPPKPAEKASSVDEYEVVADDEVQTTCPSCGALAAPEDTACLACGAELAGGGGTGILDVVPMPVLIGVVVLILVLVLGLGAKSMWEGSRPGAYAADGWAVLNEVRGTEAAPDDPRWKQAQDAFMAALEYDSDNTRAILGLAEIGAATDDSRLVETYAERAAKKLTNPEEAFQRARICLSLAKVKLGAQEFRDAYNWAVEAQADDPELADINAVIGLAALGLDDKEGALGRLEKAAAASSRDHRVYFHLAELLRDNGEFAQARTYAEEARKLAEEAGQLSTELWLLIGELREEGDDPLAAAEALAHAIQLDGTNHLAYSWLSRLLLDAGDLDGALRNAEEAKKLKPDDVETRLAFGRVLLAQGRPQAAKDEFEVVIRLEKTDKNWEAEFLLGESLIRSGDPTGGLRRMTTALDLRPDDIPLHLQAASLAIEFGEAQRAVQLLNKVLRNDTTSYALRVLKAEGLLAQDNPSRFDRDLTEVLQEAIDLDAARPEAPLLLGRYLLESKGQPGEASEVFAAALEQPANKDHKALLYWQGRASSENANVVQRANGPGPSIEHWARAHEALKHLFELDRQYTPDLENLLHRAEQEELFARQRAGQ
jgi:tetratricopeptide (TPR) repeat protein